MKNLIRLGTLSLLSLLLLGHASYSSAQSRGAELFQEAVRALERGDRAGSAKLLEKTIEAAVQESNRQLEADARAGLGSYLTGNADFESAEKQLKAAVVLYKELNNASKVASLKTFLGFNAFNRGKREEARQYYQEAMSDYVVLNDRSAIAQTHYSLAFVSTTSETWKDHIDRGLQIAHEIGDRRTEGLFLHLLADGSYSQDGFDIAFDRLDQARSIFEDLNEQQNLAGVLTSLGRLYRVHGHPDQAIPLYQQAREIQMRMVDKAGAIQSLNAIGATLNILGRPAEALITFEEALRLARETESPRLIAFMLKGLASTHLNLKHYQTAADLLEQSRLLFWTDVSVLSLQASARMWLGQYEGALKAATEGLEIGGSEEQIRGLHSDKARALSKLGRTSEAMTEIRLVTESVEKARGTLIPTDFMKQGFTDTERELTTIAVDLLLDGHQTREALATAEKARGRAFLDLLATKQLALNTTESIPALRTRGGGGDLPSTAMATSGSDDDLVMLARRLDATVLAYWVGTDSTTIWTVSPAGEVKAVRTDSGETNLNEWIDQALRPTQQSSNRKTQPVPLASRAGDTVLTGRGSEAAWKRLYNALIRPVRTSLPSKGSHRLLIIPSGPLFRLSFAALMDERGRYLIEDFSLHYTPNAGVMSHTLQIKHETQALARQYVLVANPTGMPQTDDKKVLPALPGSDDEVRRIAKLLPSATISTLRGAAATETSVRNAVESAKVIHFATHGIVNNADPFSSYLALGKGTDGSADGRLSAEEIYGLNLHADLVVLSACRSGLGYISGDGVAGLARAFFYAGTASVVATLWDVADGPASQLVADFYQSLGPMLQNDKSEALRTAQLRLLRSLRRGELRVDTPFGKLALPEDPTLWAGFVLIGEP